MEQCPIGQVLVAWRITETNQAVKKTPRMAELFSQA